MNPSKSTMLTLIVIATLAVGTALVAGYVERTAAPAQMSCAGACDGCSQQGSGACCKAQTADGCTCAQPCAKRCSAATCEPQCAGSCRQKAPPASRPMSGCEGCGMGGGSCTK